MFPLNENKGPGTEIVEEQASERAAGQCEYGLESHDGARLNTECIDGRIDDEADALDADVTDILVRFGP
jgi:hypothetical protein